MFITVDDPEDRDLSLGERLEKWRVEVFDDGSVRLKGPADSAWFVLGCPAVGTGFICGLVLLVAALQGSFRSFLPYVAWGGGGFFVFMLLVSIQTGQDMWLMLAPDGLCIETVHLPGLRTYKHVPWEKVASFSLQAVDFTPRISFKLHDGKDVEFPPGFLPPPPEGVWEWVLASAQLPEHVHQMLSAEVERALRVDHLDNQAVTNASPPPGPFLLVNTLNCVRVRSRGTTRLVGSGVFVVLLILVILGAVVVEPTSVAGTWVQRTTVGLGIAGLAVLCAATVICRETVTATPRSLEILRRGLFGTRRIAFRRRPDSIGLPDRLLSALFRPYLFVQYDEDTVRFGHVLDYQELAWLLIKLRALWDMDQCADNEAPRDAR